MGSTGRTAIAGALEAGGPEGEGDSRPTDVDIWPGDVVTYPHGREGSFLIEFGPTLAATVPMMAAMFFVSERRACQLLGRAGSRTAESGEVSAAPREFIKQTYHRRDGVESLLDSAFHTAGAIRDVAECLGEAGRWSAFALEWAAIHEDESRCWKLLEELEDAIFGKRLNLVEKELSLKEVELTATMTALRAAAEHGERAALLDRLGMMRRGLERWLKELESRDAAGDGSDHDSHVAVDDA